MPHGATPSSPSGAQVRPDGSSLSFSFTRTDTIFLARGRRGNDPVWEQGEMLPFQDLTMSPAAACLSYGLGVFEGMKARRVADGRVLLFRPEAHAQRFGRSAKLLAMEPFPAETLLEAALEMVRSNLKYVPEPGAGSFYLRPMQHGIEKKLGLGPANEYQVSIYGSPVGAYFQGGAPKGLRVRVVEHGRVPPGGSGAAKAMGNYAAAIPVTHRCRSEGFDDALFLDLEERRNLTESSGSNVFVRLRSGTVVTPPLDHQILPGITRDSTLRIAREMLELPVEERAISIQEILDDAVEMFCSGTAYTLTPIHELVYRDQERTFSSTATRNALFEMLRGIQLGTREDPYGWTVEV